MLYKEILSVIENLDFADIKQERMELLSEFSDYLKSKVRTQNNIALNFICTHNSRRSQMAQIWAKVAAHYYGFNISCYSGGTAVTAFHPNAVEAMRSFGFRINEPIEKNSNPIYTLSYSNTAEPMNLFSKEFDSPFNPKENFAAIMTCSQAAEDCPFVPGADKRISLSYEDPKAFDEKSNCQEKYRERSLQIATELFFVFHRLKKSQP